jgi:hypothetical protein
MHRRAARSGAKDHPTDKTGVGGLVRGERTRVRPCILADTGCQSFSSLYLALLAGSGGSGGGTGTDVTPEGTQTQ